MSLDTLLLQVVAHYRSRGFPRSAVSHLKRELRRNYKNGKVVFTGVYELRKTVSDLVGHFHPCDCSVPSRKLIADADAIFAFSFGYRLKRHSDGGVAARLPGPNNRALAENAVQLHRDLRLPLYAQFEIADAIEDYTESAPGYRTPAEDMGTAAAIKYFVNDRMVRNLEAFKKVVVVAHKHHVGRCLILLKDDFRINAYPYGKAYDGYDAHECQGRAKCPNETIVSDFVSMAARAKEKRR